MIFFQEVVSSSFKIIKNSLEPNYKLFSPNGLSDQNGYFTMILINTNTCRSDSELEIIEFKNSEMDRNLLKLKLIFNEKIKISAMTSHFESLAQSAEIRVEQYKYCFKEILNENKDYCVLFGGDLNAREAEVS